MSFTSCLFDRKANFRFVHSHLVLSEDEARRIIETEILFGKKKKSVQNKVQILSIVNSSVYVVSLGKFCIVLKFVFEKPNLTPVSSFSHVHRKKATVLSVPEAPV